MLDWYAEQMIVGIGNPLYTDDGFGPAVIAELKKLSIPEGIKVFDAGLAGPYFFFTLMAEAEIPVHKLVIIDILDFGGEPGQITKISPEVLVESTGDRYLDPHSWQGFKEPLKELAKRTELVIFGCQPESIELSQMDNESFDFGFWVTEKVNLAIPKAMQLALAEVGVDYGTTITSHKNLHGEIAGN